MIKHKKRFSFKSIIHSIKYIPKSEKKYNLNYLKTKPVSFYYFWRKKKRFLTKKTQNLWTIISIIFYKKDTNYFRYTHVDRMCYKCTHIYCFYFENFSYLMFIYKQRARIIFPSPKRKHYPTCETVKPNVLVIVFGKASWIYQKLIHHSICFTFQNRKTYA